MPHKPVILFAAKARVESKIAVPFAKHFIATFPKQFKTTGGAINFAKRMIEEEEGVWQLPGSKEVKNGNSNRES